MRRSTDSILTTHPGALPRPKDLDDLVRASARGEAYNQARLEELLATATGDIVRQQAGAGIDIVNDGEQGKTSFSTYVRQRLTGFDGPEEPRPVSLDDREFPGYAARRPVVGRPTCTAPVTWKDFSQVERDINNLKAGLAGVNVAEAFLTAASPGTVANFHQNAFYKDREEYLYAIAEVMRLEYEAIAAAGFTLQLDCPDLALWSVWFPDQTKEEFRKEVALNIEAMNHATRNLSPEQVRIHVCWGRSETPKKYDLPLADIVDLLLRARAVGISIVGANGRHEHEWRVWKDVKRSEELVLIPGVVDNTTNIVEHPEVVAYRLLNYMNVVGRENVIAGLDCGFGNSPNGEVDPGVAWAKMQSLVEGAALAGKLAASGVRGS